MQVVNRRIHRDEKRHLTQSTIWGLGKGWQGIGLQRTRRYLNRALFLLQILPPLKQDPRLRERSIDGKSS
jgi:hypothetical protein